MKITWLGHSCFKLEMNGYSIVTDPYAPGSVPGLGDVEESANLVLCSHQHGDHAFTDGVCLLPAAGPVPKITEYASWHDEVRGAKRGPNTLRVMDFGGFRAAHLGDLGCDLTEEQGKALYGVDVLLIPVGGFYTIDANQAARITKQLNPKIVIPMHYRDDQYKFGYNVIGTVDPFADAMGKKVRYAGSVIKTEDYAGGNAGPDEEDTQVIIMTPQNIKNS